MLFWRRLDRERVFSGREECIIDVAEFNLKAVSMLIMAYLWFL